MSVDETESATKFQRGIKCKARNRSRQSGKNERLQYVTPRVVRPHSVPLHFSCPGPAVVQLVVTPEGAFCTVQILLRIYSTATADACVFPNETTFPCLQPSKFRPQLLCPSPANNEATTPPRRTLVLS